MTFREMELEFIGKLSTVYDAGEAEAITRLIRESLASGMNRTDLAETALVDRYNSILPRLLNMEPVQYVLEQCWFCDLKLKVTPDVLIPRPETEELVAIILKENNKENSHIIDIGSGSGCIAIALKKKLPSATVTGIDISQKAVDLARLNATRLRLAVNFHQMDIFTYSDHSDFMHTYEPFDVIVSNPPYIPLSEKELMQVNVVNYEPHLALFVDDKDPLIFYRQIIHFAKVFLAEKGRIYFEIHFNQQAAILEMLKQAGFEKVRGQSDISGNNRFVIAERG